jgi:hypothetical protein
MMLQGRLQNRNQGLDNDYVYVIESARPSLTLARSAEVDFTS